MNIQLDNIKKTKNEWPDSNDDPRLEILSKNNLLQTYQDNEITESSSI